MTRSRLTARFDTGASFTLRIDWDATYRSHESRNRTMWRYVCRNRDGSIAARGSDLGDALIGDNAQRDALRSACSLLSFAEHYAETSEEITPSDRALGEWWDANDAELQMWRWDNDPDRAQVDD